MKYKYKVGDVVWYKTLKVTEVECPACGHIESEYEGTERKGKITSRDKDYAMGRELAMHHKKELQDDGTLLITPTFPEVEVSIMDNFYKVNGEAVIEAAITEKK